MIVASHVSKSYGETLVVQDVSLKLPASGVTSIVGPNGAGKSTLFSMISRLLPMNQGSITVDGLDIQTTAGDELARRMSILRQDNHILARLTVRDLVTFGRYPHSKGRPTSIDQEHVERALDHLDLQPFAERFLDELSGGQRQRAFVAMVLCQDTPYVLLDEPLNSLDLKHSVSMMQLLRRAADELHKSIILVIHDINFASCYSDHIIAMKEGRIAFQGSPEEFMQPAVLQDIYDIEITTQQIGDRHIAIYY